MKTYKFKSALVIVLVLVLMVSVGYFINDLNNTITGSIIKPVCKCIQNLDCNDYDSCTEDICLYKETCEAAVCVNNEIIGCK